MTIPLADPTSTPVLLVDDDDALRTTTADILQLHGFSTHAAANGRAAVEMAQRLTPAAIVAVVDLRLPDMNGLDLTHELRMFNPDLQVVILTGNASVESVIRAVRDEECDYLLKPIEPEQLVRTLRTAEGRWKLRRTEAELAHTQQVLRATFDASPLPIITYDRDRRVTLWNPAAERLFGWKSSEVMGRVPPIIPPESALPEHQLQDSSLRGESFVGFEVARRKRNGELVYTRLSQAPLTGPDGATTGFLAVYEDITERRRIEEHLRETQRLDAIGRLAGGMAHDFNNLLAVILGEVELALRASDVNQRTRAMLESVQHAASSGATLTRQLLTVARRQKDEPTVFNPNLLLMQMDRLLRRVVGDRVQLQMELAPDLGMVNADRQQLEQVVTNLAANARDAMPDGGTLRLATRNQAFDAEATPAGARPGAWVVIEATDSGTGIPDDVRERLFEPFFTTKERGKGTGLGLATSYGIVERCGGFITVESEVGHGSSFRVFLPHTAAELPTPDPADIPRETRGGETVLVVEDQDALRSLAMRILVSRGYSVHAVGTAAEAVETARMLDPPPDLAILDVNLPDGHGAEVARQLRQLLPSVRILLTSGADGRAAPGADEFAFLAKPFGVQTLAEAVRAALDAPGGSVE
ncbi:MAG TPA: response regulator [Gemmatimonadaceae bacterium]|nr:response regulator [Gemmatimonadaceae bacterium]